MLNNLPDFVGPGPPPESCSIMDFYGESSNTTEHVEDDSESIYEQVIQMAIKEDEEEGKEEEEEDNENVVGDNASIDEQLLHIGDREVEEEEEEEEVEEDESEEEDDVQRIWMGDGEENVDYEDIPEEEETGEEEEESGEEEEESGVEEEESGEEEEESGDEEEDSVETTSSEEDVSDITESDGQAEYDGYSSMKFKDEDLYENVDTENCDTEDVETQNFEEEASINEHHNEMTVEIEVEEEEEEEEEEEDEDYEEDEEDEEENDEEDDDVVEPAKIVDKPKVEIDEEKQLFGEDGVDVEGWADGAEAFGYYADKTVVSLSNTQNLENDCCSCGDNFYEEDKKVFSFSTLEPGRYFVENGGMIDQKRSKQEYLKAQFEEQARRVKKLKMPKLNKDLEWESLKTGILLDVSAEDSGKTVFVKFPRKHVINDSPQITKVSGTEDFRGARPKQINARQSGSKRQRVSDDGEPGDGGDQGDEGDKGEQNDQSRDSAHSDREENKCSVCLRENKLVEAVKTLNDDEQFVTSFVHEFPCSALCKKHFDAIFKFPPMKNKCSNPLNKEGHSASGKTLTKMSIVLLKDIKKFTNLNLPHPMQKVCKHCINELKVMIEDTMNQDQQSSQSQSQPDSQMSNLSSGLSQELKRQQEDESLAHCFEAMNLSPIKREKVTEKNYVNSKIKSLGNAVLKKLDMDATTTEEKNESREWIDNLKKRLEGRSYQDKLKLLSVVPESWTYARFQREFNCSKPMVKIVKELQAKNIDSKHRKSRKDKISPDVLQLIQDFYREPDISRQLPDEKHVIKVQTDDGVEELRAKHILYNNLRETFALFLIKYPHLEGSVGIEKFRQNRPIEIMLNADNSMLEICLCSHCHNPARIVESSVLASTDHFHCLFSSVNRITPKMFAEKILCPDPTRLCFMRLCTKCKDKADDLRFNIEKICEEHQISNIEYEQWVSTDRPEVVSKSDHYTEFSTKFVALIEKLSSHLYEVREQQGHYEHLKNNLPLNHCLAAGDFSENFELHECHEIQSAHFKKGHVTLFPFIVNYNENGVIKRKSCVFITNSLAHDYFDVFAFVTVLNRYIQQELLPTRTYQIFFSGKPSVTKFQNFATWDFLTVCNGSPALTPALERAWVAGCCC